MTKAQQPWTVLPHRPLEVMSPSVMTVTGDLRMPLCSLERRMTVVRLRDGRLVVYSALALDETQMNALTDFGSPAFLIVPNRYHRQDAFAWKQRYPKLIVVAPSGARAHVEDVVPIDTSTPDFQDDTVRLVAVPGTADRELALEVRDAEGVTLILNDLVGNLPQRHGLVLRALGFATEAPRVPRMVKRMLVDDAQALRAQFQAWAEQPIERILVSHGRPILTAAQEILHDLARSL